VHFYAQKIRREVMRISGSVYPEKKNKQSLNDANSSHSIAELTIPLDTMPCRAMR